MINLRPPTHVESQVKALPLQSVDIYADWATSFAARGDSKVAQVYATLAIAAAIREQGGVRV